MKYMLLIYGDESQREAMTPDEREAEMPKWYEYTMDLQNAGVLISGEPLQGTSTATTVRPDGGSIVVTDGPFAETKEALGGFYMIDVETLDEAIDWAKRCPGATWGPIEVRPLMDFPMPDAG